MRYVKFVDKTLSPERRDLEKLARQSRQWKLFWDILSGITFVLVAGVIVYLGVLALRYVLFTEPDTTSWEAFRSNIKGTACMLCVMVLALLLGGGAALAISVAEIKQRTAYTEIPRREEYRRSGCEKLREYYGYRDPVWVTKCFDSTDRPFRQQDVCLFFVDGELRITGDLHNGYFRPERDPGCYCLSLEETTVRTVQWEERTAIELTAGQTRFLLGIRTLPFLNKMWDPSADT